MRFPWLSFAFLALLIPVARNPSRAAVMAEEPPVLAEELPAEGWKQIQPGLELDFPRDHGAHLEFQTEWWYLTGEASTDDGESFGFQMTIFRRGLDPTQRKVGESALRPRHVLVGHAAVVSIATEDYRYAERIRRVGGGLGVASADGLRIALEDWEIWRLEDGRLRVRVFDRGGGFGYDLTARPTKPLVLHGVGGRSVKGPEKGNASAYVSYTRLATEGTIHYDGREHTVSGESWFDHEWGSSQLGAGVVGWDWFALRLATGEDLMIYRLRDKTGGATDHSAATLISADGAVQTLTFDDITIQETAFWRSPLSGARYPAGWRLRLKSAGYDLLVAPWVNRAELDGTKSVGIIYWEGPVRVTGSHQGRGYVELTGYASSLSGRF